MAVCYVYVKLLSLLEVKEAKMNIFCCVCVLCGLLLFFGWGERGIGG